MLSVNHLSNRHIHKLLSRFKAQQGRFQHIFFQSDPLRAPLACKRCVLGEVSTVSAQTSCQDPSNTQPLLPVFYVFLTRCACVSSPLLLSLIYAFSDGQRLFYSSAPIYVRRSCIRCRKICIYSNKDNVIYLYSLRWFLGLSFQANAAAVSDAVSSVCFPEQTDQKSTIKQLQ